MVVCVYSFGTGVWHARGLVDRDVMPRKRRLEAMLKELDAS